MRQPRISSRTVNLGLLVLIAAGVVTGLGTFLSGDVTGRWIVWAHSIAGFAIVLLLVWKRRIIMGSLRRHGIGIWAVPSLLLLALLVAALASGILWSTVGLPSVAGETALTLHAAIAVTLAIVLIPHVRAGWPGVSMKRPPGRRAFLRAALFLGAAAVLWRASEAFSAEARLSGAQRRFTGSRAAGSYSGNDFPSNSWLLDDPNPIDPESWRLSLVSAPASSRSLGLEELKSADRLTATIDCTGGWYSTQEWTGVHLERLIPDLASSSSIRSVVVRSATGYWRRLSRGQAANALLATGVGGEPLAHEHGAPLRLVVPGSRGYDWVKWVISIEASPVPAWWKWPLPVS